MIKKTCTIAAALAITALTGNLLQAQYPIPDNAKVLFIGNSLFGSGNGNVGPFTDAALKEMGYTGIEWGAVGNWASSLDWGLTNISKYNTILPGGTNQQSSYDPNAQRLLTEFIRLGPNGVEDDNDWDYVILQGYSDDQETDNANASPAAAPAYLDKTGGTYATNSAPTDSTSGQSQYTFTLESEADLTVWAKVSQPDGGANSFYYRLDEIDGAGNWNQFSSGTTSTWEWRELGTYSDLPADDYNFRLQWRETGAGIDQLYFSTDGTTPL